MELMDIVLVLIFIGGVFLVWRFAWPRDGGNLFKKKKTAMQVVHPAPYKIEEPAENLVQVLDATTQKHKTEKKTQSKSVPRKSKKQPRVLKE